MFEKNLNELADQGLLRRVTERQTPQGAIIHAGGRELINFASNDYLGLASNPDAIVEAREAAEKFGFGAGASRLLCGGTELHRELEESVARFKNTADALLFNSGYAANTGAIPALVTEGDAIFSDELNHASLIDGARLSRARVHIYKHRDMGHLSALLSMTCAGRKMIVTDSVFSMDGDVAPLADINALAREYGAWLYIDDAHGTGVLGKGRGALAHFGIWPDNGIIQMGTFSKALGSLGAFVAADQGTIDWLRNRARTFMFSTALPAPVVAASLCNLRRVEEDAELVETLWDNSRRLLKGIKTLRGDTGASQTPIVPVLRDSVDETLWMAEKLYEFGIYAPAIRPPTVQRPRIRLTASAAHTTEHIEALMLALKDIGGLHRRSI